MANQLPDRDDRILTAAVELAKGIGYQWITRDQVAEAAGVSAGTVNNAFGGMIELKRAVLRHAVEIGLVEIVAQGLADGHEIARGAPADLRAQAAAHMAGV
jgi:AcrR family transcriptional regulator